MIEISLMFQSASVTSRSPFSRLCADSIERWGYGPALARDILIEDGLVSRYLGQVLARSRHAARVRGPGREALNEPLSKPSNGLRRIT